MQKGYIITRMVDVFVGLVMVILGFRVLFRLFDANPSASFVSWIYDTSDVLYGAVSGDLSSGYYRAGQCAGCVGLVRAIGLCHFRLFTDVFPSICYYRRSSC